MAQEATIKINLEEGNSGATLKDLKNDVKAVGTEAEKVNDEFKQGQQEVEKSTISLKTQLRQLKDEMVLLDDSDPEFLRMAQEASAMEDKIKDVDAQVKLLASDTKGLDGLIGAGQAIGGAFQASQGALALFGAESEEVQKAIQNVIAVQGIMNGVQATANALNKDAVAGMYLRMAVTKLVTAGQWLLNLAMNANPIGIIIAGVGLLIGAFVLLYDELTNMKDGFSDMGKVILILLGPIGWLILAYQALAYESENLKEKQQEQTREQTKAYKTRKKEIKDLRKIEAEAHAERQTQFDRDIERLDAEGKSSFALKLAKLQDIKDEQQAKLDSYNLLLQAGIDHYKALAEINGLSEEEFIEQAKKQGVDLLAIQDKALAGQQKYKDAIFDAETQIIALKRENREKNAQEEDKATDETIEKKEKETERLLEEERKQKERLLAEKEKIENEFLDSQLSAQDRELNAVQDKYNRLIEMAQQYGEDTAILEEARQTNIDEINAKFEEERKALEKEKEELQKSKDLEKQEALQAQAEQVIESAKDVLNIIGTIQELGNRKEIERIKEKQKAGEKLSKAEKKRLINDEKQKRAIAVAEIAIDTARAIAKAVASGAGVPFPGNIPAIISGVSAVLANVASASKILSAPLPSFDSGTGSDVADSLGGDNAQDAPSINTNRNGSTILNEPPTQVVVLESDITSVQNNVQTIEAQATI